MVRTIQEAAAVILARCVPDGECLLYAGKSKPTSYRQISVNGKPKYAHRIAYEAARGPIPDGLDLMHSCDRPACIRLAHLSPGTRQQNMDDAKSKGRTCSGEKRSKANNALRGDANPCSRISSGDMPHIRFLAGLGVSQKQIASEYGVTQSCIWKRLRGKRGGSGALS